MTTRIKILTRQKEVEYFTENINGVSLDMILIPAGSFIMGAREGELESRDSERPTHLVTISTPFFMGRYPITQAQWRAVAQLPQEGKKLKLNPSRFKGDKLPVEQVSWYDAVEFCARLTRLTGKNYRLPSEAEWEYACRGKTEIPAKKQSSGGYYPPFHFGETLSTDLANYNGTSEKYGAYGKGEKGEYREKTTEVDYFDSANEFGLSDMHGNVWEWCADPWHNNYDKAPDDGSVWDENNNDNLYQNYLENIDTLLNLPRSDYVVLRGGSWINYPDNCRSASRTFIARDLFSDGYGFRVVCVSGRTL